MQQNHWKKLFKRDLQNPWSKPYDHDRLTDREEIENNQKKKNFKKKLVMSNVKIIKKIKKKESRTTWTC
jgi:hypothetical protein